MPPVKRNVLSARYKYILEATRAGLSSQENPRIELKQLFIKEAHQVIATPEESETTREAVATELSTPRTT
jgi:hypothetical protein